MKYPTITVEIGFKDPYGAYNLLMVDGKGPNCYIDPEFIRQENLELWQKACAEYGPLHPYPAYYLPTRGV